MVETAAPVWHGLAAGASSAVVSRLFTYPPDTVKARLQVQVASCGGPAYNGTVDAFFKIARSEGLPGFYRGFGAILLTVIPANMCYFSGYEFGKRITPRNWGAASDVMTATIAQTVAGVAFCPIDIVKQRVQTASVVSTANGPQRLTAWFAAQEVWRQSGIRGFYKGYWTMNALWYPWNLFYLCSYEAAKRRVYHWQLRREGFIIDGKGAGSSMTIQAFEDGHMVHTVRPMQQVLPLWSFPLCSSTCAAVASVATHPIDVVKTRLQVLATADPSKKWNVKGIAKDLYAAEGVGGFTRGMGARVATMSLGSSISWFVYEIVKRHLGAA